MAKQATAAAPAENFTANKIVMRKVDDLKPYPRNPRTHTPDQVDTLAAMIKEYGFTQPALVDEDGMILAGHGRVMAMKKLGYAQIPTIVRPGLSPSQKRAMVIADNQAAALAGWDKDLLKLELGELQLSKFPLALTGFDQASLVSYMTNPVVTPPTGFAAFDESIPTEHQCPKCSYRWSGSSAVPAEPEPRKARVAKPKK
jgi:hypothetical protein